MAIKKVKKVKNLRRNYARKRKEIPGRRQRKIKNTTDSRQIYSIV